MVTRFVSVGLCALVVSLAPGPDSANASEYSLDRVNLEQSSLDSKLPIRVQRFGTEKAYLGKAKHQDTAKIVSESAAGMLLVDLIEELRDGGYADVAEYDANEAIEGSFYLLSGDFTELNPGSQSARVIWGLGAGKSKVCVKGEVRLGPDVVAGTFADCAKSLGWGNSKDQLESEVYSLGLELARFLLEWSDL